MLVVIVVVSTAAGCSEPAVTSGQWVMQTPPAPMPSSRIAHSLVYDSSGGKAIMFGGVYAQPLGGPGSCLGDTWIYDAAADAWADAEPSGSRPCPRYGQSMVYDSGRALVFMFGGTGETGELLNDLWEYDPTANTWTELKPAGSRPSGREGQSMVWDSHAGRVLLFGGWVESDSAVSSFENDLWEYDPIANTWTELEPTDSRPPGRAQQSMIWDSDAGRVLLFGGYSVSLVTTNDSVDVPEPSINTDLWAYDPSENRWSSLEPSGDIPPWGLGQYLVYHPGMHRAILLLQTVTADGELDSRMWSYDAADNRWTRLESEGGYPPERWGAAMAFCPAEGQIMFYGGMSPAKPNEPLDFEQDTIYYDDVWFFRSSTAAEQ